MICTGTPRHAGVKVPPFRTLHSIQVAFSGQCLHSFGDGPLLILALHSAPEGLSFLANQLTLLFWAEEMEYQTTWAHECFIDAIQIPLVMLCYISIQHVHLRRRHSNMAAHILSMRHYVTMLICRCAQATGQEMNFKKTACHDGYIMRYQVVHSTLHFSCPSLPPCSSLRPLRLQWS